MDDELNANGAAHKAVDEHDVGSITDDPDNTMNSQQGTNGNTNTNGQLLSSPQKDYYTKLHDENGHNTTTTETRSALEMEGNTHNKYTHKKSSIASVGEFFHQVKASMFSSGINICNANIGAGVLGLPFAVSDSGWVMAIMLFILFAFVSTFAFQLLMSVGACYIQKGQISSYAIVCNDIAPRLQIVIDVFITFGFTLTCSAYLIIIGDYMPLVWRELFGGDDIMTSREFWILAFLIVLILPTTSLKKLDHLRFSSMIAIGCFIYVTIMVIAFALFPGFDIEDDDRGDVTALPKNALNFFEAAPLYVCSTYSQSLYTMIICTNTSGICLWRTPAGIYTDK